MRRRDGNNVGPAGWEGRMEGVVQAQSARGWPRADWPGGRRAADTGDDVSRRRVAVVADDGGWLRGGGR